MKIALFVGGMWVGGVTTYVLNLGCYLRDAGHDVTVVACDTGEWWPQIRVVGLRSKLIAPGVWTSTAGLALRLADYFTKEKYDVIFLNNGLGVRPAQLSLHRLPDDVFAVPVLHNDLERIYRHASLNQRVWHVAVAVSPKVRSASARAMPKKNIVEIPYGIETPSVNTLISRRPWEQPLRLLFVGNLSQNHKGIFLLPTILAILQRQNVATRLTIIGDGEDRLALEQAIAAHGMEAHVELSGTQSIQTVYQAMRDHHVLLLPSHFEGLPLVSLEAQANGCVPVLSRLPGIMDAAIEDGVSGFLATVDDAEDFARCVADLAADEQIWQACSSASMKRARTFFSIEVMGQRYLDLLEQLAAGRYSLAQSSRHVRLLSRESPFSFHDFLPAPLLSLFIRSRRGLATLRRRTR